MYFGQTDRRVKQEEEEGEEEEEEEEEEKEFIYDVVSCMGVRTYVPTYVGKGGRRRSYIFPVQTHKEGQLIIILKDF